MSFRNSLFKGTAIAIASSFIAGTGLPVFSASAHDRHNAYKHYGHGTSLTKKGHRRFHRTYGPGHQGKLAYQRAIGHQHGHKKRKKHDRGDLIAAGIIGLAVGALIASEASRKKHNQPSYQYSDPYNDPYQGSYSGNYSGNYNGNHQPIPLNDYDNGYDGTNGSNGPNVITYDDGYSLEPWTPGWKNWCSNRYRSFNSQTGTFRGYDGRDHFCVPK